MPQEYDLLCEQCGYSLAGLTTQTRCPECGAEFDPLELPLARVPWLYRRRIGAGRAFNKTVWMVIRHPVFFARELSRPVRISADDARQFRRIVVRRAAITVTILICALIAELNWRSFSFIPLWACPVFVLAALVGMVGSYLFFLLCTDLPTFIWSGLKGDPNKLAPLHHYACAPLALWPLVAVVELAVVSGCQWLELSRAQTAIVIVAIVIFVAFLFLTWWLPQVLMQNGSNCSTLRVAMLALYLPIHWILIAAAVGGSTTILVFIILKIGLYGL